MGQPLKMAEFMKDDFRAIYDNAVPTRRVIISRARKNAKTTESAIIVLLHVCGPEAQPNSQLFSAAQSRDQAAVLFALAAKMVRLSPELNSVVTVRDTAKQLACQELGTLYRALSAEASTAYGLSPALTIHDELGQVRGPRSALYEALETATAAQQSPLSIVISTQAPNPTDLLSLLIDDAITARDPSTVLRFQTADEKLDTFSEEAIRAANPAFDIFMNKDAVLDMMENARAMPSRQAEFENLILNRRVEMRSPFVSRTVWEACADDPGEFVGPVYAGLDLSSVSDLTALVYVGRNEAGKWGVKPVFWLPEFGLREKSRADRVPYDIWHDQGFLETTPGKSIDYDFVAARLWADCQKMDVRKVAFDRHLMRHLRPRLVEAGFAPDEVEESDNALFEPFGQGFVSMAPALRTLSAELLEGRVAHGGHPVLTMCAGNAVATMDPAGNQKLNKATATGRIDGMVALTMGLSVAVTTGDGDGGGSYLEAFDLAVA